jgi:hypothetical protein
MVALRALRTLIALRAGRSLRALASGALGGELLPVAALERSGPGRDRLQSAPCRTVITDKVIEHIYAGAAPSAARDHTWTTVRDKNFLVRRSRPNHLQSRYAVRRAKKNIE